MLRPRFFTQPKYEIGNKVINQHTLWDSLRSNDRSAPYFKTAMRQSRTALVINLSGLALLAVSGINQGNNNFGYTNQSRISNGARAALASAGVLIDLIGSRIGQKSEINMHNAINRFNLETLIAPPNLQHADAPAAKKITSNVNFLQMNYFYDNNPTKRKEIDALLLKENPNSFFVRQINTNKKIALVSGVTTLTALAVPLVFYSKELNKPINETTNPPVLYTSIGLFFAGITTYAFAQNALSHHRYNAIKIFNGETPIPFNRRIERALNNLNLGVTSSGIGLLYTIR